MMPTASFKIGDMVRCIDDWGLKRSHYLPQLRKGEIYVIDHFENEFIHLVGLKGGYYASRFSRVSDDPDPGTILTIFEQLNEASHG